MTSAEFAESIRYKIWDNRTFTDYRYYGDFYSNSSRQGTTHFSVIAENGDAVSATTTINYLWVFTRKQKEKQCRVHYSPSSSYIWLIFFISFSFGSQYRSTRTGIIYNNEMDDFSIPGKKNSYGVEPSESNMIQPGKRPQSSTAPTIFLDQDGEARLVIGASGGTRITTAISLVSSD